MSVRADVLARLQAAGGVPLSGARLAEELQISRTALWKHIRHLRAAGYAIDGTPGRGYILYAEPDLLTAAALDWPAGLVHHFARVDSTNDEARRLGLEGAPEGTLVVAEEQLRGRGRRGRVWTSPRGGIYLAWLLRPECHPAEASRLTLLAALAIADAITAATGLAARIKWPNDVLVHERKVCGILLEMSTRGDLVEFVVVGVGVNANNFFSAPASAGPPARGGRAAAATVGAADVASSAAPPPGATSLAHELGRPVDRSLLARVLIRRLEAVYVGFRAGRWPELLDLWRARCDTLGRRVRVTSVSPVSAAVNASRAAERGVPGTLEGIAVDVDADGALLLDKEDGGRARLLAGDVTLRPVD